MQPLKFVINKTKWAQEKYAINEPQHLIREGCSAIWSKTLYFIAKGREEACSENYCFQKSVQS